MTTDGKKPDGADQPGAIAGERDARPRAFISYSWKQQSWAVQLAERLMSDGIEVVIDVWDLGPGHDKYHYMERMVVDPTITHVLILCDASYKEKADQRRGGVSDETQIITPEVYGKAEQRKFIPLVIEADANGQPLKPVYLDPRLHIDFTRSQDDAYEELLRHLYNKPKFQKPNLGVTPAFLSDTGDGARQRSVSAIRRDEVIRLLERGDVTRAEVRLPEFFDCFTKCVKNSRIFSQEEDCALDESLVKRIRDVGPERDDYILVLDAWCRNTAADATLACLPDVLELLLQHCHIADRNNYLAHGFDAARLLSSEFVLHVVAQLVRYRKLCALESLSNEALVLRQPTGLSRSVGLEAFDFHYAALDDARRQRLRSDRTSPTADLLKEREHSAVPFDLLQQADLLLFLHCRIRGEFWAPRTLVFLGRYPAPFDLFVGARSERRFGVLRAMFGVQTLEEFADKFETAFPPDRRSLRLSERAWSEVDLTRLLAMPELLPQRFRRQSD